MLGGSLDSHTYRVNGHEGGLAACGLRPVFFRPRARRDETNVVSHGCGTGPQGPGRACRWRWRPLVPVLALLLLLGFGPARVVGLPPALAQASQGPAAEGSMESAADTLTANPTGEPLGDGQVPGSPAFPVAGFRFTGNTAFSQEELAGLLAAYAGRELTLADLEEAAARITRFYREQGYFLASAHVPLQEVVDGVVELAVVEGRWGQVTLDNGAGLREAVAQGLLGQVRQGELIREEPLDRAMRLLNETPGVQTRATVRAGSEPGTSDLTVVLAPEKRAGAALVVDNAGSAAMQETRVSVSAELANAAGLGDRLSVRWVGAGEAMENWRVGYEAYVAAPWRLGVSYAGTRYRLGGPFGPLDAHGTASAGQVSLRYPLARSAIARTRSGRRSSSRLSFSSHVEHWSGFSYCMACSYRSGWRSNSPSHSLGLWKKQK